MNILDGVKKLLAPYEVTLEDSFITDTFEKQIKPIVEQYVPLSEKTIEEIHHRSDASDMLILDHRNIVSISSITGSYTNIDKSAGIVYGHFPAGIVVVRYKYGSEPDADIERACVLLTTSFLLGFVGAETGGGALGVQGYSRNYGARGKYHDIREEYDRNAYVILKRYYTGI